MSFQINVLIAAPRAEHMVVSPFMTYEEAQADFRTIRKQCDEGGEILRSCLFAPAGSVVTVHLSEDRSVEPPA